MNPSAHTPSVIAIDGPAASGKSSVARELARRLDFSYVNSGAMYRAVTWLALQRGLDPGDAHAVARLIESTPIQCDLQNNHSHIVVDGVDPSQFLREQRVNDGVSVVSSVPRVREILVEKMRAYGVDRDVVMEGRDIGSVVFPHTPFKFYIDASPDVRSRRRAAEGQHDQIAVRDRADSSRRDSPLIIAADAVLIDSSDISIDEVVSEIIAHCRMKGLA